MAKKVKGETMEPASEKLSESRRLALLMLAHHYLARNKDGKAQRPISRKEWFEQLYSGEWKREQPKRDKANKDFSNFLQVASSQSANFIYIDLKEKMATRSYYQAASAPVRKAIEAAFEYRNQNSRDSSIAATIEKITEQGKPFADELLGGYDGLWDVIRYSAHGDQTRELRGEARIMRAAMKVSLAVNEGDETTFELRYKPHQTLKSDGFHVSKGSVLVLGNADHLLFMGWESPTKYPIMIVAPKEIRGANGKVDFFRGLVVRHHEKRYMFASRVMFLRSSVSSFDELNSKIGMSFHSELKEALLAEHQGLTDFESLMKNIVNKVGCDGRSGLLLE